MNDKDFIKMAAECVVGEHGEYARFVAAFTLMSNAVAGVVLPPAKRFVDEVEEATVDLQEQRIMDLMMLVKR